MIDYIRKILTAERDVLGINKRNLQLIYPNNPRKSFYIADDKAETKRLLEANRIPVPETYTIIERSWEIGEKLGYLAGFQDIVMKPSKGSGGNGILILSQAGRDKWITPGGEAYNISMLHMHAARIIYGAFAHDNEDKCIIEQRLRSHPLLAEIYPEGIADIRMIYYKDRLLMAMLRIPTKMSGGKANLHQGAMGIGIDIEHGSLTQGFYRNKTSYVHPDSGIEFCGLNIPFWKKIVSVGNATAKLVPLKYLGIDVIVDEERGPQIIEINVRPGLQIQNVNHQGLVQIINE